MLPGIWDVSDQSLVLLPENRSLIPLFSMAFSSNFDFLSFPLSLATSEDDIGNICLRIYPSLVPAQRKIGTQRSFPLLKYLSPFSSIQTVVSNEFHGMNFTHPKTYYNSLYFGSTCQDTIEDT